MCFSVWAHEWTNSKYGRKQVVHLKNSRRFHKVSRDSVIYWFYSKLYIICKSQHSTNLRFIDRKEPTKNIHCSTIRDRVRQYSMKDINKCKMSNPVALDISSFTDSSVSFIHRVTPILDKYLTRLEFRELEFIILVTETINLKRKVPFTSGPCDIVSNPDNGVLRTYPIVKRAPMSHSLVPLR